MEGLRGRHKQVLRDRDCTEKAQQLAEPRQRQPRKVGRDSSSTGEGPCPLPHPAGVLGNQGGSSVTSLLWNQWNRSVCAMLCCLLLLALLLGAALPQPVHQR